MNYVKIQEELYRLSKPDWVIPVSSNDFNLSIISQHIEELTQWKNMRHSNSNQMITFIINLHAEDINNHLNQLLYHIDEESAIPRIL